MHERRERLVEMSSLNYNVFNYILSVCIYFSDKIKYDDECEEYRLTAGMFMQICLYLNGFYACRFNIAYEPSEIGNVYNPVNYSYRKRI